MHLGNGAYLHKGYLEPDAQRGLLDLIRQIVSPSDFYTPQMPRTGKPMSVRMTNLGVLGWVTDQEKGYRYQSHHPVTGAPWPLMPDALVEIWSQMSNYPAPPEACLVNHYSKSSRMGLHRDQDEEARDAPVVSISLGSEATFRLGGPERSSPTSSFTLSSGDVLVLSGGSRHFFHGIDRIKGGTSHVLQDGGRLNLTLRRVTEPSG